MVRRLPPSKDGDTPGGADGYSRNDTAAGGVVSAADDDDDDDAGSRFGAAESRLGATNSTVFSSRESGEEERHQEGRWEVNSSDRRSGYCSPDATRLTSGSTAMPNDREDQHHQHHHQRQSPLAFNKSSSNNTNNKHHLHHHHNNHHHHHHHLKAPAGVNNGSGTPSRVATESLSLEGFDTSPSSGAATVASGVNSSGSGSRINPPSTPTGGGTPSRSSLGSAGLKARGPGRASPSINSPGSLSPGRRGGGGDVSGIIGGGNGISPKKQGRRSTDSQIIGRKSVDSQGGVSHNFKVRCDIPERTGGGGIFRRRLVLHWVGRYRLCDGCCRRCRCRGKQCGCMWRATDCLCWWGLDGGTGLIPSCLFPCLVRPHRSS